MIAPDTQQPSEDNDTESILFGGIHDFLLLVKKEPSFIAVEPREVLRIEYENVIKAVPFAGQRYAATYRVETENPSNYEIDYQELVGVDSDKPVEEIRDSAELPEIRKYFEFDVDREFMRGIIDRILSLSLTPFIGPLFYFEDDDVFIHAGLDGTTYSISFISDSGSMSLSWWEETQPQWHEVSEIATALLNYARDTVKRLS